MALPESPPLPAVLALLGLPVPRYRLVDVLAEALLEHETLEGVHVMEILEHGEIRSPVKKGETKVEEKEPVVAAAEKAKKKQPGKELDPGGEPAGAPA